MFQEMGRSFVCRLEDAKRVQIDERTKGEAYSEGREVAKGEKQ